MQLRYLFTLTARRRPSKLLEALGMGGIVDSVCVCVCVFSQLLLMMNRQEPELTEGQGFATPKYYVANLAPPKRNRISVFIYGISLSKKKKKSRFDGTL